MENEKIKKDACKHYKQCGGCQLLNLTYSEQLSHKQVKVIRLLGKYCHVDEIIGMEDPTHYRCKVQSAFGKFKGNTVCGIYQSSTHKIVPVTSCLIEDKESDSIIKSILKLVKQFKIEPFDEDRNKGFLRHVLIRKGYYTHKFLVVLVTAQEKFPCKSDFIDVLLKEHPEITTIVQNINNKFTSLVLGDKEIVLYGDGYITDKILGKTFRISPKSFYQVNPQMTQILYSKAIEFASLSGKETVLDAYCGTGTIGIAASDNAKRVIGVEINKDAIKDAKENAKINKVNNIDFICDNADNFINYLSDKKEKIDTVIMDPPRAGSTISFMNSVIKLSPKKVVYVSCNPETLARDVAYFVKNEYRVKKIQPVDMFPNTAHVETVVLLTRKG